MATPRFETPVYFLRSRAGEVLGPFTLSEVKSQLDARKISNDGEMRRQGWEVLEKEELWGKIKDFPIFGYSGPTGRHEVYALKAKARSVWRVGIALLVITLAAFVGMFFIPFQEAEQKMKEAQAIEAKAKQDNVNFRKRVDDEVATAKKQWTTEFDANLKQWDNDKSKVASDLIKTSQALRTSELKLAAESANVSRLEGELKVALAEGAEARRIKDKAVSDLSRVERDYKKKFESMDASFEARVSQTEANLKQEFESLVERHKSASKGDLLQVLSNPKMARVMDSSNQGKGRLVLIVAQRPPVGAHLELFDGEKVLRVTVPSQVLGPPMMVVDVDPGQADSASSLGFLGLEVLMRPAR
jgi:hypothetical protein